MPSQSGRDVVVMHLPDGDTIIELRPDFVPPSGGGRSGQFVKNLIGPPKSAFRSPKPGRVWVTNAQGQIILDIENDRTKLVQPTTGFQEKRDPTPQERDLVLRLWRK